MTGGRKSPPAPTIRLPAMPNAESPSLPLAAAWREVATDRRLALEGAGSVALLAFGLWSLSNAVAIVEARKGAVLPDPFLALFGAVDLTWPVFALIYAGLAVAFLLLLREPRALFFGCRAYGLMALFRFATMWATPLDPPAGMILLRDPFVEFFVPASFTPTRDLFFSGHTGTATLLALLAPRRWARRAIGFSVPLIAAAVLLQKVHYTVDVLAAPPFAWAAYSLAKRFLPGSAPRPAAPSTR